MTVPSHYMNEESMRFLRAEAQRRRDERDQKALAALANVLNRRSSGDRRINPDRRVDQFPVISAWERT